MNLTQNADPQRTGGLSPDVRRRLGRLILGAAAICAAGALYVAVIHSFGIGIRCPFERITGLSCPGCGVSGMFLCLLHGDLSGAFHSNPLTFCLLPGFLGLGIWLTRQYLRFGYLKTGRYLDIALILLIGVYLVFGVWRNLA